MQKTCPENDATRVAEIRQYLLISRPDEPFLLDSPSEHRSVSCIQQRCYVCDATAADDSTKHMRWILAVLPVISLIQAEEDLMRTREDLPLEECHSIGSLDLHYVLVHLRDKPANFEYKARQLRCHVSNE